MGLKTSQRSRWGGTFRRVIPAGWGARLAVLLCSASLAHGARPVAAPTPPPAPRVPPVISVSDAADRNGNHIDDTLETRVSLQSGLSIASVPEMVAVES